MNIELRPLRCFLQVVESEGFSAAARAMNISQPALSRTIGQLEGQLGGKVFDRDTRNLALTELGKELKVVAERLLADAELSLSRLGELARGVRGEIAVGALPTVAAWLIPAAIASFERRCPGVEVRIRDDLNGPIVDGVIDGTIDVGVTIRPPARQELKFQSLIEDRFVAVGDRRHGIGRGAVRWEDLGQLPYVGFPRSSSIRQLADAGFLQAGIAVEPRFEVRALATAGGLVSAGLCVTAVPEMALLQLALDPASRSDVGVSLLVEPTMKRGLGIVTSARRSLPSSARAFVDCLISEAKRSPRGLALFEGSAPPAN